MVKQLTGLVVCGGYSSRMGQDKSLLDYHGIAQRYHIYHLLEAFCDNVLISCNPSQAESIEPAYAFLADDEKYGDSGPIAALLTAFDAYPANTFLMVGCDYPFIKREDIQQLVDGRNENDGVISFFNSAAGLYEPLLAIYENKIGGSIFECFKHVQFSLQDILKDSMAHKIRPNDMRTIKSVDTPEDYFVAINEMKQERNY